MSKIKLLVNLKENNNMILKDKCFFGVRTDEKIFYKEDEIMVTIFVTNNKIIMKRESLEYEINLEFIEGKITTGKYFINNGNLWLPLDTFTDKILVDDSYIRIEYTLTLDENETKFLFEIKYEVTE